MVKDFDQGGHKDLHCDEENGKPCKDKGQPAGQSQAKANKYWEQQDGGYPRISLSRDKEQGGSRRCEANNSGYKWGNCGQRSGTRGYTPMTAERTDNFSRLDQKNQHALARERKQPAYQTYSERQKVDQGGSSTSYFEKNPDISRCTPMTDVRPVRQAHLEEECQKKLFIGAEQGMQRRKSNPERFASHQIRSINKNLASGMVNASKVSATDGLVSTPSNKMQTALASDNSDTKPVSATDGLDSTPSNKMQPALASDNSDIKPVYKPQSVARIKLNDSDSENTPIQITRLKTQLVVIQELAQPARSAAHLLEKTPIQKKLPLENSTDGDSSASTTREKSCTPTITDVENSVHYDCRLDKVLRVAVDYALPEEHAK